MSNMIDIYLSMNSCVRDKNDNVFYIELGEEPQLLGQLTGHYIKNGILNIDITAKQNVDFLTINVTITKDNIKVEDGVD